MGCVWQFTKSRIFRKSPARRNKRLSFALARRKRLRLFRLSGARPMVYATAHLQPIVSVIAGILILIMP